MKRVQLETRNPHYVHAVRFYPDPAALCRIAAEFLAEGLSAGEPALIFATPTHSAGILQELKTKVDVAGLQRDGALLLLDAEEILAGLMTAAGQPDSASFSRLLNGAIDDACRGRRDCTVRIYGELVDVLWQRDQHEAAIRLEVLWNQLATTRDFSLLCGYCMGRFYKDTHLQEICDQHTHAVSGDGEIGPIASATAGLKH